jgi:hypothetical protein
VHEPDRVDVCGGVCCRYVYADADTPMPMPTPTVVSSNVWLMKYLGLWLGRFHCRFVRRRNRESPPIPPQEILGTRSLPCLEHARWSMVQACACRHLPVRVFACVRAHDNVHECLCSGVGMWGLARKKKKKEKN